MRLLFAEGFSSQPIVHGHLQPGALQHGDRVERLEQVPVIPPAYREPDPDETTTEKSHTRMDTKANPVDSLTASSAGGVVTSGQPSDLPWRIDTDARDTEHVGIWDARSAFGFTHQVATAYRLVGRDADANAEFIVTACNAHGALVAQRDELRRVLIGVMSIHGVRELVSQSVFGSIGDRADEMIAKADAKAEGREA